MFSHTDIPAGRLADPRKTESNTARYNYVPVSNDNWWWWRFMGGGGIGMTG